MSITPRATPNFKVPSPTIVSIEVEGKFTPFQNLPADEFVANLTDRLKSNTPRSATKKLLNTPPSASVSSIPSSSCDSGLNSPTFSLLFSPENRSADNSNITTPATSGRASPCASPLRTFSVKERNSEVFSNEPAKEGGNLDAIRDGTQGLEFAPSSMVSDATIKPSHYCTEKLSVDTLGTMLPTETNASTEPTSSGRDSNSRPPIIRITTDELKYIHYIKEIKAARQKAEDQKRIDASRKCRKPTDLEALAAAAATSKARKINATEPGQTSNEARHPPASSRNTLTLPSVVSLDTYDMERYRVPAGIEEATRRAEDEFTMKSAYIGPLQLLKRMAGRCPSTSARLLVTPAAPPKVSKIEIFVRMATLTVTASLVEEDEYASSHLTLAYYTKSSRAHHTDMKFNSKLSPYNLISSLPDSHGAPLHSSKHTPPPAGDTITRSAGLSGKCRTRPDFPIKSRIFPKLSPSQLPEPFDSSPESLGIPPLLPSRLAARFSPSQLPEPFESSPEPSSSLSSVAELQRQSNTTKPATGVSRSRHLDSSPEVSHTPPTSPVKLKPIATKTNWRYQRAAKRDSRAKIYRRQKTGKTAGGLYDRNTSDAL